jgi:hypothetical protein
MSGTFVRSSTLALCLVAVAASARAQDDAAASRAALETEYSEREAAYYEALDAYYRPYAEAKTPEEAAAIRLDPAAHPSREFLAMFLDLMRRARGCDTGVRAAAMTFRLRREAGKDGVPKVKEVLGELAEHHLESPALGRLLIELVDHFDVSTKALDDFATTVEERSPLPESKAASIVARGMAYARRRSPIEKAAPEKARAYFERAISNHPTAAATAVARTEMFELEHLRVGATPPDFEAVDQDGVKFKLSDYRGKVLVLDFWGFW